MIIPAGEADIAFQSTALRHYFQSSGHLPDEEAALMAVMRSGLADGRPLTTRDIIIRLVTALECTADVIQADVIRSLPEIIPGHASAGE
ncbi:biofilm development regulator YmgB/AriR family protein [Pantoea sp. BAV 3049]|uniref:biofilm development regulator YmgB/AriR family protein n=1 Tax=Pantoea sp. BAV 3049 TaxID=2654188 RepID=UPI00131A8DBC|nr:biofilm development regulator YmgB/AriR family protein [Pantoea sp. BAV 3049]